MFAKTKICSHCHLELSINQFYKNKSKKDGLGHCCKRCQNEYTIERKKMNNSKSTIFKWKCDYGHENILDYDPTIERKKWDNRKCDKEW